MTELNQVYKCNVCGNLAAVLHTGAGQLICCNKPMDLLKENSVDASKEKHVPVIEKAGDKVIIKVGEVEHPMEEKHFIEWIEVIAGSKVFRKFLRPGEKPAAEFKIDSDNIIARIYCNLHGLWINRG